MIGASSAIVMVTMPAIGAYADLRAAKKRVLAMATAGCVLATAALAITGPGDLWLAVIAIVVSNTFYSYGESLTAAFLPELATPSRWAACRAGAGASATSAGCCRWA